MGKLLSVKIYILLRSYHCPFWINKHIFELVWRFPSHLKINSGDKELNKFFKKRVWKCCISKFHSRLIFSHSLKLVIFIVGLTGIGSQIQPILTFQKSFFRKKYFSAALLSSCTRWNKASMENEDFKISSFNCWKRRDNCSLCWKEGEKETESILINHSF